MITSQGSKRVDMTINKFVKLNGEFFDRLYVHKVYFHVMLHFSENVLNLEWIKMLSLIYW